MTRQSEPDQACADAIDLARAAAEADAGPGQVGAHVGIEVEGDRVVTHLFACLNPAYVGWRWAVTVTRASRARQVTVDESVLLPGPDSLLPPAWVPWTERVRPGDLKAGDLLPAGADDERLVPVVALAGQAGLLDWEETDSWRLGLEQAGLPADQLAEGAPETGEPATPATPSGPATAAAAESTAAESTATESSAADSSAADSSAADSTAAGASVAETGPADQPAGQPGAGTGPSAAAPAKTEARGGTRGRARRRPGSARVREESVRLLRPSRVLSAVGRDDAAVRWYTSEQGPKSPLTAAAPANCMTCGFMVRVSGPLGRLFGVCANEFAPDDGKVVSVDHGCGAHSEGETPPDPVTDAVTPAVDELGYDMVNTGATVPESVLESIDQELR